jgi:23S rRNA (pseudouridine1915-N3)-methyltransferase
MRRIKLICFGKLKEPHWRQAAAEYEKRLGAYCRLETIELPPAVLPENPGSAQIARALLQEAGAARQRVPAGAAVVALCAGGRRMTSEAFSVWLATQTAAVAFLVGSSHGLEESLQAEAALQLSMSDMTFPHQLARVMLLEQLYRALNLANGGKYHK